MSVSSYGDMRCELCLLRVCALCVSVSSRFGRGAWVAPRRRRVERSTFGGLFDLRSHRYNSPPSPPLITNGYHDEVRRRRPHHLGGCQGAPAGERLPTGLPTPQRILSSELTPCRLPAHDHDHGRQGRDQEGCQQLVRWRARPLPSAPTGRHLLALALLCKANATPPAPGGRRSCACAPPYGPCGAGSAPSAPCAARKGAAATV